MRIDRGLHTNTRIVLSYVYCSGWVDYSTPQPQDVCTPSSASYILRTAYRFSCLYSNNIIQVINTRHTRFPSGLLTPRSTWSSTITSIQWLLAAESGPHTYNPHSSLSLKLSRLKMRYLHCWCSSWAARTWDPLPCGGGCWRAPQFDWN